MTSLALDVRGLRYAYPDGTEALCDVTFGIGTGDRVALIGPNGAGKTTLVLAVIGLLKPLDGTIRVGDLELSDTTAAELRRRVGVVFQDPDDQLFMTSVWKDVEFGPANAGVRGADLVGRVNRALETVGMEYAKDRTPHHLSVGERRRVAIATVLAMEPEILVLDEPSANLDPEGRERLAHLLLGLRSTILVITHDLPYAAEVCDRALVMNAGRITTDGKIGDVLGDEEGLRANHLCLPKGFDPALSRRVEGAIE